MLDWLLNFLFVAVLLTAALLTIYFMVHSYFPTFGTLAMNFITTLPAVMMPFLDGLSSLPWAQILTPKLVGAVLFAIAAANFLARLNGPKKPVGSA